MSSKHPPKGNEHPGVMNLAQSTTRHVKPLGKEGGTISGKPGDRVNPWGDQDRNTGSVKPGEMPMMPNWMAVYDDDDDEHEKRKKAERHDSGEGTNESVLLFDDAFAELVNEAVDENDTDTLVEAIEGLAKQVALLTEENAELNRVAFEYVCRKILDQHTVGMSAVERERLWSLMIDDEDMERMAIDIDYCAKRMGFLKEAVTNRGKCRRYGGIDESWEWKEYGFGANQIREDHVDPIVQQALDCLRSQGFQGTAQQGGMVKESVDYAEPKADAEFRTLLASKMR